MRTPTRRSLMLVFLFLLMPALAAGQDPESVKLIAAITEAHRATRENLRSGTGTGVYEVYTSPKGPAELKLFRKAKVTTYFDRPKYHIRLDYEMDNAPRAFRSRIIIYDGSALFTRWIHKSHQPNSPHGSGVDIYKLKPGYTAPADAGFPYDPGLMSDAVIQPDAFFKNVFPVTFTKRADGRYTGSYAQDGVITGSIELSPETGTHIASDKVYANNGKFLGTERAVKWRQANGLWFVTSAEEKINSLHGYSERTVFTYTRFEPNVPVSLDLFKFPALQLPTGARIFDRTVEGVPAKIYSNVPPPGIDPANFNNLLEYVRSLPERRLSP